VLSIARLLPSTILENQIATPLQRGLGHVQHRNVLIFETTFYARVLGDKAGVSFLSMDHAIT